VHAAQMFGEQLDHGGAGQVVGADVHERWQAGEPRSCRSSAGRAEPRWVRPAAGRCCGVVWKSVRAKREPTKDTG
jgi:hypothetical protein